MLETIGYNHTCACTHIPASAPYYALPWDYSTPIPTPGVLPAFISFQMFLITVFSFLFGSVSAPYDVFLLFILQFLSFISTFI